MNKIRIIALITLLTVSKNGFCQNHLDFISKDNVKKLTFNIGDRIGYVEKGFTIVRTGKLQEIKDSLIIVNGKTIRTQDIRLIGHRKKGTVLISIATAAASGFALGYLTLPNNNSTTQKNIGLSISIPLFTMGQIIGWKNRLHKVQNKYKFEVSPTSKSF
jgi:hypothetical protein